MCVSVSINNCCSSWYFGMIYTPFQHRTSNESRLIYESRSKFSTLIYSYNYSLTFLIGLNSFLAIECVFLSSFFHLFIQATFNQNPFVSEKVLQCMFQAHFSRLIIQKMQEKSNFLVNKSLLVTLKKKHNQHITR